MLRKSNLILEARKITIKYIPWKEGKINKDKSRY